MATIGTTNDGVNLRNGPSTTTDILSVLTKGTQLEVLGTEGDFLWVKTADKVGYVAKQYVDVPGGIPTTPPTSSKQITSASGNLNVRSAPMISTSPDNKIDAVTAGDALTPLEDDASVSAKVGTTQDQNQWIRVRTPSGKEGFVAAWLVIYLGTATVPPTQPAPQPTQQPSTPQPSTPQPAPTGTVSGATIQPDLHNFINGISASYPIPQGYYDFWAQRTKLGLPDPFDISPTQLAASAIGRMPVNGFGPNTFSSLYWSQYYKNVCGMHNGLDHIIPVGTPLVALSDGIIVGTQSQWPFMGNPQELCTILWCYLPDSIRDSQGRRMLSNVLVAYAHMSNNTTVQRHQQVKAGQVIGLSGHPVGEPNNAHLHLEIHLLSGDTSLGAGRKLLSDYKGPQPFDNHTPFNPMLFFSEKLVKYHLNQGKVIGFGSDPTYPSPAKVSSLGLNWPALDFFTIAQFKYGSTPIWSVKSTPWPAGIYDLPTLIQRIGSYAAFNPYPADFL